MCLAASVYAEQLLPKGHGYPLWIPEPDAHQDEIRIGDVGYVWEGSFCTLFNSMLPASHPANRNGVPDGFVPLTFNSKELVRTRDMYLPDAPVCSQTVRRVSATAHAGVSSVVSGVGAHTHLGFECIRNKGGVLILNGGGAVQDVLRPNDTFPKYMQQYHDSWYEFSRQRGHDISPEDIVMVRGTVKAAEWTVAAFTDETRHQFLHLDAQGGGLASVGVSLALSEATSMSVEHRSSASKCSPLIAHDRPRNQCVFLSRYKMRYRKFWWRGGIRAAGYRKDEPTSDDEFAETFISDPSYCDDFIESDFAYAKPKDPLDALADYILENSRCDIAFVSDEDIKIWIESGHSAAPDRFESELFSLNPHIDISTERGRLVGRLSSLCQAGSASTDLASLFTSAMHHHQFLNPLDLDNLPCAALEAADISSNNHSNVLPSHSLPPITFSPIGQAPQLSSSSSPNTTCLMDSCIAHRNIMSPIPQELYLSSVESAELYEGTPASGDRIMGTNVFGDDYGGGTTLFHANAVNHRPQTNRLAFQPRSSDTTLKYQVPFELCHFIDWIRGKGGRRKEMDSDGSTPMLRGAGVKYKLALLYLPQKLRGSHSNSYCKRHRPSACTEGPNFPPTGHTSTPLLSDKSRATEHYASWGSHETGPMRRNEPDPRNTPPRNRVSARLKWPGYAKTEEKLPGGSSEEIREKSEYSKSPINGATDMWPRWEVLPGTLPTHGSERSRGFAGSIAVMFWKLINYGRIGSSQETEWQCFDSKMPQNIWLGDAHHTAHKFTLEDGLEFSLCRDRRRRHRWSLLFLALCLCFAAICAAVLALFQSSANAV